MYIDLVTINLCPGQGGGGVKPSGSLEISENGIYDVYSYSSASVDVHPSTSLSETYISNGNYNITGEFNGGVITVDVPAPQFVTETLNVSANGTYTPGQGVDGFSTVTVDVPQSVTGYTQKEITEGICITNLNNSASFVGNYAFYSNSCLTTVDLPMCEVIKYNAFGYCPSLTTINLPVCSYISSYAFNRCNSLSEVNLPKCKKIGQNALYGCLLLSLDLPMCSYIGYGALGDCSSLTTINLPMCERIENEVFKRCYSLSAIDLPICSYIGSWAFEDCSSLKIANLPECSYIGIVAFNRCKSLSEVNLPKCESIGENMFNSCFSLQEITVGTGIDTVCVLKASNAFKGCSALTSIYVPASLVDSYKTATNWTYFSDKIVGI